MRGAAPQALPIGAHAGLDGVILSKTWIVGLGAHGSATMVAQPVMFLGRFTLYVDFGRVGRKDDFFGLGLEGGVQFGSGIGGLPTAGFLFVPFVFRHFTAPGPC